MALIWLLCDSKVVCVHLRHCFSLWISINVLRCKLIFVNYSWNNLEQSKHNFLGKHKKENVPQYNNRYKRFSPYLKMYLCKYRCFKGTTRSETHHLKLDLNVSLSVILVRMMLRMKMNNLRMSQKIFFSSPENDVCSCFIFLKTRWPSSISARIGSTSLSLTCSYSLNTILSLHYVSSTREGANIKYLKGIE